MKTKLKRPKIPTCAACWDKGWHSHLSVLNASADFFGDKSSSTMQLKRNYCPCKKGQKLKKQENDKRK